MNCVGDSSAFFLVVVFFLMAMWDVFCNVLLDHIMGRHHTLHMTGTQLISVMESTVCGDVNLRQRERERERIFIFNVLNWESVTDLRQNETESLLV